MKKILLASFLSLALFSSEAQTTIGSRVKDHIKATLYILLKGTSPIIFYETAKKLNQMTEKIPVAFLGAILATYLYTKIPETIQVNYADSYNKNERGLVEDLSSLTYAVSFVFYPLYFLPRVN